MLRLFWMTIALCVIASSGVYAAPPKSAGSALRELAIELVLIRFDGTTFEMLSRDAGFSDDQHVYFERLWKSYEDGLAELVARTRQSIDPDEVDRLIAIDDAPSRAALHDLFSRLERANRMPSDQLRQTLIQSMREVMDDVQHHQFDRVIQREVRRAALRMAGLSTASRHDFISHIDLRQVSEVLFAELQSDRLLCASQFKLIQGAVNGALDNAEREVGSVIIPLQYQWKDAFDAAGRARAIRDRAAFEAARRSMYQRYIRLMHMIVSEADRIASVLDELTPDLGWPASALPLGSEWMARVWDAYLPHAVGAESTTVLYRHLLTVLEADDPASEAIQETYQIYAAERDLLIREVVRIAQDEIDEMEHLYPSREWSDRLRSVQARRVRLYERTRESLAVLLSDDDRAEFEERADRLRIILDCHSIPIEAPARWRNDSGSIHRQSRAALSGSQFKK